MQFVLPYVRPVQHSQQQTSNITLCETSQDEVNTNEHNLNEPTDETEKEPVSRDTFSKTVTQRKVKRRSDDVDEAFMQYFKKKKDNPNHDDPRRMFLLSLLPDVASLSDTNLRQFKIQTMLFLEDLLTKQMYETTSLPQQTSLSPSVTQDTGFAATSSSASCTLSPHQSVGSSQPSPINYPTSEPTPNFTRDASNVSYTDLNVTMQQLESTHPFRMP